MERPSLPAFNSRATTASSSPRLDRGSDIVLDDPPPAFVLAGARDDHPSAGCESESHPTLADWSVASTLAHTPREDWALVHVMTAYALAPGADVRLDAPKEHPVEFLRPSYKHRLHDYVGPSYESMSFRGCAPEMDWATKHSRMQLWGHGPLTLSCQSGAIIVPSRIPSGVFARGWMALPAELQIDIMQYLTTARRNFVHGLDGGSRLRIGRANDLHFFRNYAMPFVAAGTGTYAATASPGCQDLSNFSRLARQTFWEHNIFSFDSATLDTFTRLPLRMPLSDFLLRLEYDCHISAKELRIIRQLPHWTARCRNARITIRVHWQVEGFEPIPDGPGLDDRVIAETSRHLQDRLRDCCASLCSPGGGDPLAFRNPVRCVFVGTPFLTYTRNYLRGLPLVEGSPEDAREDERRFGVVAYDQMGEYGVEHTERLLAGMFGSQSST